MKRGLLVAVWLAVVASTSAANDTYHFNVYVFDAKEMYRPAGEGDGNPDVCRHLFAAPQIYDGRHIPVGTNAVAFGVVAVTDGRTTKIIPLFKWTDDQREVPLWMQRTDSVVCPMGGVRERSPQDHNRSDQEEMTAQPRPAGYVASRRPRGRTFA